MTRDYIYPEEQKELTLWQRIKKHGWNARIF